MLIEKFLCWTENHVFQMKVREEERKRENNWENWIRNQPLHRIVAFDSFKCESYKTNCNVYFFYRWQMQMNISHNLLDFSCKLRRLLNKWPEIELFRGMCRTRESERGHIESYELFTKQKRKKITWYGYGDEVILPTLHLKCEITW